MMMGKSHMHWWEGPLALFALIGKDQIAMGKAHMHLWEGLLIFFYTHRERLDGGGKDQVVMGKAHIHLWEGPLIFFTLTGKDRMVVGKTMW
jgi:hypothetical protein